MILPPPQTQWYCHTDHHSGCFALITIAEYTVDPVTSNTEYILLALHATTPWEPWQWKTLQLYPLFPDKFSTKITWMPVRAINSRRISLVPSKIRKILKSRNTFSRPASWKQTTSLLYIFKHYSTFNGCTFGMDNWKMNINTVNVLQILRQLCLLVQHWQLSWRAICIYLILKTNLFFMFEKMSDIVVL